MATVRLSGVSKSFDEVEVLKNINLDIADREFAVFVGPSGCGKSTLLRLIAGLEEVTAGDIFINGERINEVPPSRRGLAMVFQSYALYPHMSVADNLGFSLRLARFHRKEREDKVREAARILRIESLLERKPGQLSGGQRQRVAIGRAIVRSPKVFLFDEPLSNLDAALRLQMRLEIMRLHQDLSTTMIYVTHDQIEAMTMADKIVVLNQGAVEQVGSPLELYHHPRSFFVAGFIGSPKMNFIPARVSGTGDAAVRVTLPDGTALEVPVKAGALQQDEKVTLGVRPEHLNLGESGEFRGEVRVVERLGSATYLHVQAEKGPMLTIEVEGDNPVRCHDVIGISIKKDACHLFNEAGTAIPRVR